MQFVSYFDFGTNIHPVPWETQFIEDTQEESQEFRESLELGIPDEFRTESGHAFQRHSSLTLGIVAKQQCESFEKACRAKNPAKRLFISFGVLII